MGISTSAYPLGIRSLFIRYFSRKLYFSPIYSMVICLLTRKLTGTLSRMTYSPTDQHGVNNAEVAQMWQNIALISESTTDLGANL